AALEHGGVGQRAEQLRLRDEQLRQEIAAGAEPHESVQQLWTGREQLDVARARAGGGEKALELIERLVRIGTLPAGVEEGRDQPRKGGAQRAGIRRSEEHTSELQSQSKVVCRLPLEKKKT